jgi:hypothetical protein
MIILDILNPEQDDDDLNIQKQVDVKQEISKEEVLKKLPRTSLQVISIDGTIISQ